MTSFTVRQLKNRCPTSKVDGYVDQDGVTHAGEPSGKVKMQAAYGTEILGRSKMGFPSVWYWGGYERNNEAYYTVRDLCMEAYRCINGVNLKEMGVKAPSSRK